MTDSMIGVCNLEYPVFMAWVEANRPEGCEVINTGQDLEWLSKHPEMLFPQDSKTAAQWFSIVQHRAQRLYFKAHKLDSIILGRRRADGNYVGRKSNIYTDVKGITRFSPFPTGHTSISWRSSTTTNCRCPLSTAGRTAISAALTPGPPANGRAARRTAGGRSITSTRAWL